MRISAFGTIAGLTRVDKLMRRGHLSLTVPASAAGRQRSPSALRSIAYTAPVLDRSFRRTRTSLRPSPEMSPERQRARSRRLLGESSVRIRHGGVESRSVGVRWLGENEVLSSVSIDVRHQEAGRDDRIRRFVTALTGAGRAGRRPVRRACRTRAARPRRQARPPAFSRARLELGVSRPPPRPARRRSGRRWRKRSSRFGCPVAATGSRTLSAAGSPADEDPRRPPPRGGGGRSVG